MNAHHWRECRPVALDISGDSSPSGETLRTTRALLVVWARLGDDERKSFHRVCCLNSRAPADLAVIEHISKAVEAEVDDAAFVMICRGATFEGDVVLPSGRVVSGEEMTRWCAEEGRRG